MSSVDSKILIKGLIENFKEKGLDVPFANYEGYEEPKQIRDHTPDVIAWDPFKEMYYLGTVASPDQLTNKHTEKKFDELSGMMMGKGQSYGERIPLYVGVPKECGERVDQQIEEQGLASRGNIHSLEVGGLK